MDQIFNASGSTGAGTGEVLCVHIESKVLSEFSSLLIQVAFFPACVHIWYKLCTFNFNFNFLPKYVSVAKALIVKAY